MIVRQVSFGLEEAFIEPFRAFWANAYRPAMSRQAGFIAARLLQGQGDGAKLQEGAKFQIEIEFIDDASARAWRESEAHEALKPDFKQFIPASCLQVFDVL